jgi:hypothetical protein
LVNKNIDNLHLFEGSSIQAGYAKAIEKALSNPIVKDALKNCHLSAAKVATHSLRKSAATFVSSGTDGTPMHFTILLRGGWTVGNVLDRYFSQADHGDRLIANLLAGRDFYSKDFSLLIPHFLPNKNLQENLLKSLFTGKYIDDHYEELDGVLQMLVAQLVYHFDKLEEILGNTHPVVCNMHRNQLNHPDLKNSLGPKFECPETNLKATGQGGSIVYQRLGRIETKVDNILQILENNNTGNARLCIST